MSRSTPQNCLDPVKLTLDTCSKLMPGMQEEAAEKIDAGLRAALAG